MSGTKKKGRTENTKGSAKSGRNAAEKNAVPDLRLEEKTDTEGIARDIILLLSLVCVAVLVISNLGFGGTIGNAVSSFLYGLFGIMAFLLPFYCFFLLAFSMANRGSLLIRRKMLGFILLFVFLCAFFQLILTEEFVKDTSITEYFYNSYESHSGGGVVGGLITFLFTLGFSKVIAYILTAAALIISVILITQKPLVTELREKTRQGAGELRRIRNEYYNADDIYEDDLYDPDLFDSPAKRGSGRKPSGKKKPGSGRRSGTSAEKDISSGSRKIRDIDLNSLLIEEEEHRAPEQTEKRARKAPGKARADDSSGNRRMPSFLREAGGKKDASEPASASARGTNSVYPEITIEGIGAEPAQREDENGEDGVYTSLTLPKSGGRPKKKSAVVPKTAPAEEKEENASSAEPPKRRSAERNPRSSRTDIEEGIESIRTEIGESGDTGPEYMLPSTELLTKGSQQAGDTKEHLIETANKLEQVFRDFGVNVHVINVSRGPTVTRYELQPEQGVKVSKIVSLSDDIKLNLAASEIRIEAPIPGKAAVGIEVPNKEYTPVNFRELIESNEYKKAKAPLVFAVGKDIAGKPVIADIAKMPHLLIAGTTGSGKSVCINTLIMSVLYKSTPEEVRMLMIDPKVVELKIYDGIPHLLIPVVTDPKKAAGALNWAVHEMNDRYNKFAEFTGVRDIRSYNERIERINETLPPEEKMKKLPQILIIVDELADLMMVAPGEVEDAICRLAQLARAAGLHLVIATQRPSVNVVTGLIKANMPSRIALAVSSGVDSRTIIDMNGAEKLLGKGDMLFYPQGYPKPARVQGAFLSDNDIAEVVKFLSSQTNQAVYNKDVEEKIIEKINNSGSESGGADSEQDEYFVRAGRFIIEKDKASIGMLQRMFKIGFNRAARIMDQLCEAGVVGPEEGTKPRKILMTMEEFDSHFA
ncbi:MAG: DNA translocase FtsK [Lachnospiraceae bacterium]|nr:DNA translocase FtsK [Lachnospiraceae bacterium]